MRQFATRTNRFWLAVVGLLLLLAAAGSAAVGTGVWTRLVGSRGPRAGDRLIGGWADEFFAHLPVVLGVGLLGLVVGLLGVAWLLAQVPRTNAAAPFRLHDDAVSGLTTCSSSVLADAVSSDIQTLPGVTSADAVLRGTATEPELTVRMIANDQADIQGLLRDLYAGPMANLHTALGVPLHRLAVQVDISPERRTADSITV